MRLGEVLVRMCWLPEESWAMKGDMKVHLILLRLRYAAPIGPRQLLHALGGMASTSSAILLKLGKFQSFGCRACGSAPDELALQKNWAHSRPPAGVTQEAEREASRSSTGPWARDLEI